MFQFEFYPFLFLLKRIRYLFEIAVQSYDQITPQFWKIISRFTNKLIIITIIFI